MWNPVNNNDQTGQVAARMETTLGSASISVSQQQAPKKCAPPMVAPKPKFNPYKHAGEPAFSDAAGNHTGGTRFTMKPLDDPPLVSRSLS